MVKTRNSKKNKLVNMVENYLSLQNCIDLIPKCDGLSKELGQFVEIIKLISAKCDPAWSQIVLTYAKTQLSGTAYDAIKHKPISTFDELSSALAAQSPEYSLKYLELKLITFKQQPREKIREYKARLDSIIEPLIKESTKGVDGTSSEAIINLIKKRALTSFVSGLKVQLKIYLELKESKDLNDAVEYALRKEMEIENDEKTNRVLSGFGTQISVNYCTNCNRDGHSISNCRRVVESQSRNNLICNYCKFRGHLIQDCRKRVRETPIRGQHAGCCCPSIHYYSLLH